MFRDKTGIACIFNPGAREPEVAEGLTRHFGQAAADCARTFHQSLPGYKPTPLVSLKNLAVKLQVDRIWVKDESRRFSLKAFKVLGASYALADLLSRTFQLENRDLAFDLFKAPEVQRDLRNLTVVTATDGNHGRALAWAAEQVGCRAVVYMPRGSSPARVENIQSHGARTTVIEGDYDDAVHLAAAQSAEQGWILVQDSSWRGYRDIPLKIMQGYLTMMHEVLEQLGKERPTHVFLQCGVGSFAAAVQAYLFERFGHGRPVCAVVEPIQAACLFDSVSSGKTGPCKARGDLHTIMAGLACGEPSILAWNILRSLSDAFFACPDATAVRGIRALARPVGDDPSLISGESGAVTLGLLMALRETCSCRETADRLKLDQNARILLVSTEGDTDPDMYRKILLEENRDSG